MAAQANLRREGYRRIPGVVAMSQAPEENQVAGEIGLADAITQVRAELEQAIAAGAASDLAFKAESVEMEFEVALARNVAGEAGVHVWVVSVGAKGELSSSHSHRVKLVMTPVLRATGRNPLIRDIAAE
jgi:hypothetical protein